MKGNKGNLILKPVFIIALILIVSLSAVSIFAAQSSECDLWCRLVNVFTGKMTTTQTCPGNGILENNRCFYLGSSGQNCDDVCSGQGMECSATSWNDDASCTKLNSFLQLESLSCGSCFGADNPNAPYYYPGFTDCAYSTTVPACDSSGSIRRLCACEFIPVCGNWIREGTEECDDGGNVDGDGCSANCIIEFCGDGITNQGWETCDDGNTNSGDGCDANCQIEEDNDNDGVYDDIDNCPSVYNPEQNDSDVYSSINVALGKPYTASPDPGLWWYPDEGNSQLTNNAIKEETYFNGTDEIEASVGWGSYTDPEIIIDLGAVYNRLHRVNVYVGGGGGGGISAPQNIQVLVSSDNVLWGGVANQGIQNDTEQWVDILIGPLSARYVKLVFTNSAEWTMLGEIEVYNIIGDGTGDACDCDDGMCDGREMLYCLSQETPDFSCVKDNDNDNYPNTCVNYTDGRHYGAGYSYGYGFGYGYGYGCGIESYKFGEGLGYGIIDSNPSDANFWTLIKQYSFDIADFFGTALGFRTTAQITELDNGMGFGYEYCSPDCDDSNNQIYPGAVETCNGIDDNCDCFIDEGFDIDGDGIANCFDNCPSNYNPGQEDTDEDGTGNACEATIVGEMPGTYSEETLEQDGSITVCLFNITTQRKILCAKVPVGEVLNLLETGVESYDKLIKIRGMDKEKTVYFYNSPSQLCVLDSEELSSLNADDSCQDSWEFILNCPGSAGDPNGGTVNCAMDGTTAIIGPLDHSGIATFVAAARHRGCTWQWNCSEWSECYSDGIQIRTCVNTGTCFNNDNPPLTAQNCTYTPVPVPPAEEPVPPVEIPPEKIPPGKLAAAKLIYWDSVAALIVLIAIIAIALRFLFPGKKARHKAK